MSITDTMPAGQLAALDQAIAAFREACRAFAYREISGEEWHAAEQAMRAAGTDAAAGLVTIPVICVRFGDVRSDGARKVAANGNGDGAYWACWRGRSLPFGADTRTYAEPWAELVQVRA